jgi:thiosulfate/3-mercaptopyruvate sulfurtransferase
MVPEVMMPRYVVPLALTLLAACSPLARRGLAPESPDPRAALLISPSQLAPLVESAGSAAGSSLVLLHVGTAAEYAAAHLPGARHVSVAQVSVSDTARRLSVEMPGADTLRARLAALGIADDSRVVVYVGKDMLYPATRVLFTLFHAGLGGRAVLLDGGQAAWVAQGRPTTATVPTPASAPLSRLALRSFVVEAAYVNSMIGKSGVAIVDARDAEFFTGARRGGSAQAPHRAGHIPSAKNVPWTQLYDAQWRLKPREELARIFAAAGVAAGDLIIGYCHTGQQATAMLLAARALGHRVQLYDGSFQDWSARAELAVEKDD